MSEPRLTQDTFDPAHPEHPHAGTGPSPSAEPSAEPSADTASADAPHQPPGEGPSDRTTMTAVVDAYRAGGFTGDFFAEPGTPPGPTAIVRCGTCGSALEPWRLEMHSIRRLEGASDPADMSAVVATTCPVCRTDGTIVVSYGPMASDVDADVFLAMRDRRADDVLPPGRPPEADEVGST